MVAAAMVLMIVMVVLMMCGAVDHDGDRVSDDVWC